MYLLSEAGALYGHPDVSVHQHHDFATQGIQCVQVMPHTAHLNSSELKRKGMENAERWKGLSP